MGDTLLKGYLHIKCANPGRIVRKAWRKRWLVVEFPVCDQDEVKPELGGGSPQGLSPQGRSSSCLLVRVYVSHHHENKGPPAFCLPLAGVHALHRIHSRSVGGQFSMKLSPK